MPYVVICAPRSAEGGILADPEADPEQAHARDQGDRGGHPDQEGHFPESGQQSGGPAAAGAVRSPCARPTTARRGGTPARAIPGLRRCWAHRRIGRNEPNLARRARFLGGSRLAPELRLVSRPPYIVVSHPLPPGHQPGLSARGLPPRGLRAGRRDRYNHWGPMARPADACWPRQCGLAGDESGQAILRRRTGGNAVASRAPFEDVFSRSPCRGRC